MTLNAGSTPTWVATPMIAKIIGVFFGAPPTFLGGAKFYYNTPSAICQEKSCTKIKKFGRPNLCTLPC